MQPHGALQDVCRRYQQDVHQRRDQLPRSGGFGAVTITKSITIDCHEIFASILASGTTGIIINIAVNANDPLRTVRLRNLNVNGTGAAGTVGEQTGINGIRIIQAAKVYIEDVLVSDFAQNGILDERVAGGRLNILNTTLRNNLGAGILVSPSSGSTRIDVVMDRVTSAGNNEGMIFNNGPRVLINNSTSSNNTDRASRPRPRLDRRRSTSTAAWSATTAALPW